MDSHKRPQLDHSNRFNLKSIGVWRKRDTDLSIQDLHKFNHYRGGIGPHNSQIHKLENDSLEPYLQVFKSLAGMMNEIDQEEDFIYVPDLRIRERLKKAKPYLTHDGRVATFIDFIQIFEGLQPVRSEYESFSVKITEEVCLNIADFDRTVFRGFATDQFMDRKEAWESLTPHLDKVLDNKVQRRLQTVVAGQTDWSIEEVNFFTNKGTNKTCIICDVFTDWTGQKMPIPYDIWTRGSKMKWPELCIQ